MAVLVVTPKPLELFLTPFQVASGVCVEQHSSAFCSIMPCRCGDAGSIPFFLHKLKILEASPVRPQQKNSSEISLLGWPSSLHVDFCVTNQAHESTRQRGSLRGGKLCLPSCQDAVACFQSQLILLKVNSQVTYEAERHMSWALLLSLNVTEAAHSRPL